MNTLTRCLAFAAVALCGALAGSAVVIRNVHPRIKHDAARAHALPTAYLLARRSECDGAFDFLSVFEREEVAASVGFDGIYVIGNATDSALVDSVAKAHDVRATVRRADNALILQRRAMGYRGAVIVVTDQDERVIVARPVPSTPSGHAALVRLLATTRS